MDRRKFIQAASLGLPVAGSAFISSCETVNNSNDQGDLDSDLDVIFSGAEFEASGVKTYETALAAPGLIVSPDSRVVASLFMSHHQEHFAALNKVLLDNGRQIPDISQIGPVAGTETVTNELEAVNLALNVEFSAAQFYFSGINDQLTTNSVKKLFADIYAVETAHAMLYKFFLGKVPAVNSAFFQGLTI